MREKRTIQASIFDVFSNHQLGRELKAMSAWLDEHFEVLGRVGADLGRHGVKPTGRKGLSAEAVLRCALLKQHRQLSYEELAFYLCDSTSFRAFARLPVHWTPKKSVLQSTISAISAETWEAINRCLMSHAMKARVEDGKMMRLDSTVADAPIHPPSDSSHLEVTPSRYSLAGGKPYGEGQLKGAKNMSYQTPITVRTAVNRIWKHDYVLPAIQREFIWRVP